MVICYEEHQPWFTKEASWHKIDIYSMKTATPVNTRIRP